MATRLGLFSLVDDDEDTLVSPVPRATLGPPSMSDGSTIDFYRGPTIRPLSFDDKLRFVTNPVGAALSAVFDPGQFVQDIAPNPRLPTVSRDFSRGALGQVRRAQEDAAIQQNILASLTEMEQLRDLYEAQKQEAIRRAGRAAGAPYAAAIRRINEEIARLRMGLGNIDTLFDRKIEGVRGAYDEAIAKIETSADAPLAKLEAIDADSKQRIEAVFTDTQKNMDSMLKRMGADEQTAAAVTAGVGEIEEEIENLDEIDANKHRELLQKAEDLAVASARAAKSQSALEFYRQKVLIESQLKEQIVKLEADRREAVARQAAAVRAAREAEAARWPDNVPFSESAFGLIAADNYLDNAFANVRESDRDRLKQVTLNLIELGLPKSEIKLLLTPPAPGQTHPLADKYNFDWNQLFGGLPREVLTLAAKHLPNAVETFGRAQDHYRNTLGAVDPWQLPPNSAGRASALFQWALKQGMSEREAQFFARDPANHTSEKPDYIRSIFG